MQADECARRLRAMLDEGAFADGARLPPERDLVTTLGASRGTLRKALAVLEAEGRIWRHVGQGTFAGNARPRQPSLTGLTSMTSPAEVMEVRMLLEPGIAGLAAVRATPAELQEIGGCIDKAATVSDITTFEQWDGRFHRLIALSARNAMLMMLFDAVNAAREDKLWGRLKSVSVTPERQVVYLDQHRAILAAIRDRDAAAAEAAMAIHLATVQKHLLNR